MIEKRPSLSPRVGALPEEWGMFDDDTLTTIKQRQGCRCANCGRKEDRQHGILLQCHHIIPRSIAWQLGFKEKAVASHENGVFLCTAMECHPRFNDEVYLHGTLFQEVLLQEGRTEDLLRFKVPKGAIDGRRTFRR